MRESIRWAGPEDAAAMAELIGMLAAANGETTTLTADYVRSFLAGPGMSAFLAEVDGHAVGLLTYSLRPSLYHAASSMMVEELFVRPTHRGLGLGKRLLAEAVEYGRTHGCAEISVSTALDNHAAQALYRSQGLTDESVLLERHF